MRSQISDLQNNIRKVSIMNIRHYSQWHNSENKFSVMCQHTLENSCNVHVILFIQQYGTGIDQCTGIILTSTLVPKTYELQESKNKTAGAFKYKKKLER